MNRILALDPSGTSISGLFCFENWSSYEINSISAKKWLEQAKKIENYLKNKQVQILLIETTNLYKKSGYTYEMPALIKLVGLLEYLALELGIECHLISNRFMPQWERQAKEGKIAGLELKKVKKESGRPKNVWFFKERELNEHEKDALLVFYVYWVKKLRKDWPWS